MLHNVFEFEFLLEHFPEPYPTFEIIEGGRSHGLVFEYDFAELHEFVDLYGSVVVVIEFHAYIGDVLDVPVSMQRYLILYL
jgi:hypothetical protein